MDLTIELGSVVYCADGKVGVAGCMVINPNRNHLDYLIIHPNHAGRDYYVPARYIRATDSDRIELDLNLAELDALPPLSAGVPEYAEGTVHSNLMLLCVACDGAQVLSTHGGLLGRVRGIIVDDEHRCDAVAPVW